MRTQPLISPTEPFNLEAPGAATMERGDGPSIPPNRRAQVELPTFDLHKVEESLRTNHRLWEGRPLDNKEIERGIREYRQFLADHKAAGAPERFEVPSRLVDRVWHTHMCETKQYRDDCTAYFGKIVEHRNEICDGAGAGQPDGDK